MAKLNFYFLVYLERYQSIWRSLYMCTISLTISTRIIAGILPRLCHTLQIFSIWLMQDTISWNMASFFPFWWPLKLRSLKSRKLLLDNRTSMVNSVNNGMWWRVHLIKIVAGRYDLKKDFGIWGCSDMKFF